MGRARQRRRLAREERARATAADAGLGAASGALRSYPSFTRVVASPWFLVAVLALAAALRVTHVFALRKTPFFNHLQLDHRAYDEWAWEIARGDWLGTKVFFVDPLYAYFLGGLYALFGHDLLAARLSQAVLGVGTCALCAVLGRRVLGSAALGNLAALIVALFVPAIFYEAAIEKTGLALFLFTLALALFFFDSLTAVALSGIARMASRF